MYAGFPKSLHRSYEHFLWEGFISKVIQKHFSGNYSVSTLYSVFIVSILL